MFPISEVQILAFFHAVTIQSSLKPGIRVRAISLGLSSARYTTSCFMSAQLHFFSLNPTAPAPVPWW